MDDALARLRKAAEQLALFGAPPAPNLTLRPSKVDPTVRRWQAPEQPPDTREPMPEDLGPDMLAYLDATFARGYADVRPELYQFDQNARRWANWIKRTYPRFSGSGEDAEQLREAFAIILAGVVRDRDEDGTTGWGSAMYPGGQAMAMGLVAGRRTLWRMWERDRQPVRRPLGPEAWSRPQDHAHVAHWLARYGRGLGRRDRERALAEFDRAPYDLWRGFRMDLASPLPKVGDRLPLVGLTSFSGVRDMAASYLVTGGHGMLLRVAAEDAREAIAASAHTVCGDNVAPVEIVVPHDVAVVVSVVPGPQPVVTVRLERLEEP